MNLLIPGLSFVLYGNRHSINRTESAEEGSEIKHTVMFKYKSYGERSAMKNDEMVTDANMLVTQNTITQDQIEEVNIYLEYEEGSRLLTNLGYSFYYNLMQQNMHPADADRYANLNTILGYDVGKDIFTAIDGYVWEHDYDLLELSGSKEDKKILKDAAEKLQMSLDFSKWKNLSGQQYDYLFFEGTGSSGSDNFENGNRAISKTHTFA